MGRGGGWCSLRPGEHCLLIGQYIPNTRLSLVRAGGLRGRTITGPSMGTARPGLRMIGGREMTSPEAASASGEAELSGDRRVRDTRIVTTCPSGPLTTPARSVQASDWSILLILASHWSGRDLRHRGEVQSGAAAAAEERGDEEWRGLDWGRGQVTLASDWLICVIY